MQSRQLQRLVHVPGVNTILAPDGHSHNTMTKLHRCGWRGGPERLRQKMRQNVLELKFLLRSRPFEAHRPGWDGTVLRYRTTVPHPAFVMMMARQLIPSLSFFPVVKNVVHIQLELVLQYCTGVQVLYILMVLQHCTTPGLEYCTMVPQWEYTVVLQCSTIFNQGRTTVQNRFLLILQYRSTPTQLTRNGKYYIPLDHQQKVNNILSVVQ